ncbi:hypothetical protein [Variovorax sp. Sphag1AA]|uniref:hypothetical protein n=1 Tax=Variovorax sp. Sphag1AA TaxID=2587027 RepID=UPI001621852F|nr:hypothetical protein [Variovorax sp. Sphag1AA]MBB3182401.1 hypothetical protein [Variovorax sp. Sphag1AA]
MSDVQWVGVAFAAAALLFFVVAYFFPPKQSSAPILRIISAFFAGAAGMFLTGSVVVQISGELSANAKYAVNAAGAIALFILVWFTYPTHKPSAKPGFHASFPHGTTFEQAALLIGEINGSNVTLDGFTEIQKLSTLQKFDLHEANAARALVALANLTTPGSIPQYKVQNTVGGYQISAK